MYKDQKIVYLKAITPIHAGAGEDLGIADMPIQREKHSNIPKIEASTLKGAIKHDLYKKFKNENERKDLYTIFGPKEGDEYASAIGFTDARLLLFPIKSATNIFKLITCPYVIKRWIEDLEIKYYNKPEQKEKKYGWIKKFNLDDGYCIGIEDKQPKIILEEYVFQNSTDSEKISNIKSLFNNIDDIDMERIVVISDSDFIDLVTMYTEIITRNKIDVETGAAEETGLFTEEYLPTETILYFMVLASPSFNERNVKGSKDIIDYFNKHVPEVFQVGGNATIGKGFIKRLGKSNEEAKLC